MISEYERLGGHFPEDIEWQIREFALPKYRKPLNKQILVRLTNGIRQNLCDEITQFETLKRWIWDITEAEYGGWLGWREAMIDQYGWISTLPSWNWDWKEKLRIHLSFGGMESSTGIPSNFTKIKQKTKN